MIYNASNLAAFFWRTSSRLAIFLAILALTCNSFSMGFFCFFGSFFLFFASALSLINGVAAINKGEDDAFFVLAFFPAATGIIPILNGWEGDVECYIANTVLGNKSGAVLGGVLAGVETMDG